ncbi:MAG: hypothetical protein A2Z19_01470 [Deltaproteobacteria bacterium RBG_16_54_18]|nr:MAG: hypothetical protein A2Z19_01470 [Deltaproteobacteria bacterium RBG_16_54_18]
MKFHLLLTKVTSFLKTAFKFFNDFFFSLFRTSSTKIPMLFFHHCLLSELAKEEGVHCKAIFTFLEPQRKESIYSKTHPCIFASSLERWAAEATAAIMAPRSL